MKEIQLEITSTGGVRMLHDDAIDLSEFGKVNVKRASHVEYADDPAGWYVQSAETLIVVKSGMKTRAEALAWEKQHYAPSGAGWTELTGGNS